MQEIRWNPVIKWWVMVSDERENRPLDPVDYCPFCPGSKKIPYEYDVLSYDNDWPILSPSPPEIEYLNQPIYKNERSFGKCEVILYSSDHNKTLADLSDEHISKLIDLWTERYLNIGAMDFVKYVFIFENRGREVGATITHPHGQIYGFSFIPKKIETELASCKEYFEKEKKNLYLDILRKELDDGRRIIDENEGFVTFVPFFAEYPYQVYVIPKRHILSIDEFNIDEKRMFGRTLKRIINIYNNVFRRDFPYMMCFDQKPVDGNEYPFYQFHVEFYPPLRNEKTQKFNASSETGGWVHGNPSSPEGKAGELRKIKERLYDKE